MLPLDLHVLSLPLAFILSQDQTLHCIISIFKFFFLDPIRSYISKASGSSCLAACLTLCFFHIALSLLLRLHLLNELLHRTSRDALPAAASVLPSPRAGSPARGLSLSSAPLEKDCKSTTFFLSDKFFLKKVFNNPLSEVSGNPVPLLRASKGLPFRICMFCMR